MDEKPPFSSPVKEYMMESYICNEDGTEVLDNKATWKYNQDHTISEIYQYDPKTRFSESSRYSYDKDRNLMEVTVNIEDGEQKKHLIYDYKDNFLDRITEIAGDYKIVTRYDDCGNPSEKQTFTRADLQISTTMFVNLYDENGRLVEKHTVFPANESEWIDKFQYNAAGRLIEEQKTRRQLVSTVKHSYNGKGDLILSDFNPGESNHETLKKEIIYNRNDDIIEIKEYRKGWCYQDHNDEFGLTGIARYSYVR
jgi:YD repeat-containing protein